MLENNEGVQWGNLSELPLAVGTGRESPVQLPWGLVPPVWCCRASHSLAHPWKRGPEGGQRVKKRRHFCENLL